MIYIYNEIRNALKFIYGILISRDILFFNRYKKLNHRKMKYYIKETILKM